MSKISKAVANISRFRNRLGTVRGLTAYSKIALFKRLPGSQGNVINLDIAGISTPVKLRPKTTDAHAFWQVFIEGDYDFPVPYMPNFIVDAGAHVGFASLYLAKRFPKARLFAIEPEPANADMFAANTESHTNIELHRGALWNNHNPLNIENPGADSWSFRVQEEDASGGGIPSITIDDILNETRRIDILKLDIEGAENELFSGDTPWLKNVGMVVIEFHERYKPGSTEMIHNVMKDYGFEKVLEKGENVIFQMPGKNAQT